MEESLEDVALVKNRFETAFLPKYRGLWKSMVMAQQNSKNNSNINTKKPETPPPPSFGGFMDAIQNKKTISIKIDDHGDDCECCVPPILEWEEQESADNGNNNDFKKSVPVRNDSDSQLESNQLENKATATESNEEYFSTREDISEDEGASKEENDDKDESHSSGSTAVHFDISFVVQPSPNNRQKDERGLDQKLESQEVDEDDRENSHEDTDGDSSQSSGNTAVHFDISHIVHSSSEKDENGHSTPDRNSQVPLEQNLFTPQHATHFSPASTVPPTSSSLDGALVAGFACLKVNHEARPSPVCTHTDSPNKTSSSSKLHHEVVDKDIGEDDDADHYDDDATDDESDTDDDSSQSSGDTAVHFDISHIVHSPKKDDHGTSTPDENSEAPVDRILFTPQQMTNFSPASTTTPKPHSLDEELMAGFAGLQVGQVAHTSPVCTYPDSPYQKGSDRKVDSEEIDKDDDDDTVSESSGSTAVHFDMSHIVHSSPDKDMRDAPKLSTPIQATFSSPTHTKTPQPIPDSADRRVLHDGPTSPTRPKAEASTLDKNSRLVDLSDSSSEDKEVIPKAEANTKRLAPTNMPTAKPHPTRILQVAGGEDTSSEEEEWDGNVSDEAEWIDSSDDEVESKARPHDNIKRRDNQVITFIDTSDAECSFDSKFSSDEELENRNPNHLETPSKKKSQSPKMSKAAFRRNRQSLAEEHFSDFNKAAFGGQIASVEVIWSNKLRTTAGLTRLKKSCMNMRPGIPQERVASIELSTKVLDDPERLRSTLLHEMVHAAAWIIDGVSRPPHGPAFKKWAKLAMKNIPDAEVTTTHDYQIQYKYAWACTKPGCTFVVKRHSRSVDLKRHCCGKCRSKLVEIQAPTASGGKSESIDKTPKKKAPLSGYNLFVKEQSQKVRERLIKEHKEQGVRDPRVSQPDVMKECARLWREQKQN